MQVWRLTKTRFAATPFDGEGPRRYGARWNSRGTRVAYASSNSALAVLEVLVHLSAGGPPVGYSLVSATVPDALVDTSDPLLLPDDWNVSPVPTSAQLFGDQWIASGRALALRVPSVIVPGGFNLLINPQHRDFARVTVDAVTAFDFDARLLR